MIFFIHKWGRFWAKIFFCTGVSRGRRYGHYVSCGNGGKGDVECTSENQIGKTILVGYAVSDSYQTRAYWNGRIRKARIFIQKPKFLIQIVNIYQKFSILSFF